MFNYCGYALVGVGLLFIGQVNFFGIQVLASHPHHYVTMTHLVLITMLILKL